MIRVCRLGLALLVAAGPPCARAAMRDALSATRLFSGLIETHLVRFELPVGPAGAPRKVHAVALAFDGALWLYTPGLGTCLLGRLPAGAPATAAEIANRLRRLAPAVRDVKVYGNPVLPPWQEIGDSLRNGCFAGCLYELAQLYTRGEPVSAAGVVFFSARRADDVSSAPADRLGDIGHSVLVYRLKDRWWALDPVRPENPLPLRRMQPAAAIDPMLLDHARRANYPLRRVQFLSFSDEALVHLRRAALWRAFRTVSPDLTDSS